MIARDVLKQIDDDLNHSNIESANTLGCINKLKHMSISAIQGEKWALDSKFVCTLIKT